MVPRRKRGERSSNALRVIAAGRLSGGSSPTYGGGGGGGGGGAVSSGPAASGSGGRFGSVSGGVVALIPKASPLRPSSVKAGQGQSEPAAQSSLRFAVGKAGSSQPH